MDVKNKQVADIISDSLKNDDVTSESLAELNKKIDDSQIQDETADDDTEESDDNTMLEGYSEEQLSKLSMEELVEKLKNLLDKPIPQIRNIVSRLRVIYYKKRQDRLEELRRKFQEQGGDPENFKTPQDVLDIDRKFTDLYNHYKDLREKYDEEQRRILEQNYQEKLKIIERIEELINSKENFNKVYDEFKQLQNKWREIGRVPEEVYKDLMKKWNKVRNRFYDFVKINQEFKDYDMQRNLEQKKALIERAEALLYEPDARKAYKELQQLHREWKEIGPVPREMREQIWEQFKKISKEINKKHQEYYKKLKEIQKKNLEAKLKLIEMAEQVAQLELETIKDWQEKTKLIIELQNLWRKVGRVPKKYNQSVYERFRKACDTFFDRKRQFLRQHKELLEENYKKKLQLAELAEKLRDSTEWGKTAREFERLFEQWKKIGPVPHEKSEELWQRFRQARLEFFRRKRQHMKEVRKQEKENLKKKLELIEEIKNLQLSDNQEENIKLLEDIEKRWAQIGFVPYKDKDRINKLYRQVLDEKFSKVNLDQESRLKLRFEQRLKSILASDNPKPALAQEIEYYRGLLNKIKADAIKLEENLEMFKDTPEEMLKDFHERLERLNSQINLYDSFIQTLVREYKKLG